MGRIRTEARTRTGSDCNFFQNWRIRTASDSENFCCFNVIILKTSKILVVIRFHRIAKWQCIFCHQMQKLCWDYFANCIHCCLHITLSFSSNVNIVECLVSMLAVRLFVGSVLTISFGLACRDYTFNRNAFNALFQKVSGLCLGCIFKCPFSVAFRLGFWF